MTKAKQLGRQIQDGTDDSAITHEAIAILWNRQNVGRIQWDDLEKKVDETLLQADGEVIYIFDDWSFLRIQGSFANELTCNAGEVPEYARRDFHTIN